MKDHDGKSVPDHGGSSAWGRAILRERARLLARKRVREESDAERVQVLEFLLAGGKYGIECSFVREVCPLDGITAVPCTPPWVAGIINVHGRIISVVNLKTFFSLPGPALTDLDRVIVLAGLEGEEMEFGVLADAILGLRSIAAEAVQPPPPALLGIEAGMLRGITADCTAILDGAKLLSHNGIIIREETDRSPASSRF